MFVRRQVCDVFNHFWWKRLRRCRIEQHWDSFRFTVRGHLLYRLDWNFELEEHECLLVKKVFEFLIRENDSFVRRLDDDDRIIFLSQYDMGRTRHFIPYDLNMCDIDIVSFEVFNHLLSERITSHATDHLYSAA